MKNILVALNAVILIAALLVLASTTVQSGGGAVFSGTVTSTSGGFEFPDGTVQSSAYASPDKWIFIGTSEPINVFSGLPDLDSRCQVNFGPGTRMCYSTEVISTLEWPAPAFFLSTWGITRPVVTGARTNATGDEEVCDTSGVCAIQLNCSGWSGQGFAVTVNETGILGVITCQPDPGVACCAIAPYDPPPPET